MKIEKAIIEIQRNQFVIEQACVLGGTGLLGWNIVNALIAQQIPTKVLVRDINKFKSLYPTGKPPGEIDVLEGSMDLNQAIAIVCEDADVIFPCFDTDKNRSATLPRWVSKTADIAAAINANLIYPGTTNVFRESEARKITEEHPLDAISMEGRLHIALEQRIARSVAEGASVTLVRLPPLFGPAGSNAFSRVFSNAVSKRPTTWYGDNTLEREILYSVDAARIMVALAQCDASINVVINLPGKTITPKSWVAQIYEKLGHEGPYMVNPSAFNQLIHKLFSREPEPEQYGPRVFLDGTKINQILDQITYTSMDEAISQTLEWFKLQD